MKALFEKVPQAEHASFQSKIREDSIFEFDWHYHPEFELTFIEKGRGNRLIGDQLSPFDDGDLIFVGPNLPHTWSSIPLPDNSLSRAYVIQFKNDIISPEQLSMVEFKHINHLFERSSRGISFGNRTVEELGKELKELNDLDGIEKLMSLFKLLDRLGQSDDYELVTSPHYTSSLSTNNENRLDKVCRFIDDNFAMGINLDQAASMCSMTKTSFCRFFKKMTGKSFSDYLNEVRVTQACVMLIDTDKSITQIALISGFTSITHFNRMFHRKKGVSPREFRKKAKVNTK